MEYRIEKDSMGEMQVPADRYWAAQTQRSCENFEIGVDIEIMPRAMSHERMVKKAREIYDAGCTHIGLWDTYGRTRRRSEWNMWRGIGHMDSLDSVLEAQASLRSLVRLTELGGKSVRAYMATWGG